MLKIVAWNVNSINMRLMHLEMLARDEQPDIILLQELKCQEEKFPLDQVNDLGYNAVLFGQKSYNGVAILSKTPLEDVQKGFSRHQEEARYIEAVTNIKGQIVRVASVYVPNGQAVKSEKFLHKLDFLSALYDELTSKLSHDELFVIGGDYNVAPRALDVYDPIALEGTLGFHKQEREGFARFLAHGFYDSFATLYPTTQMFSWWDYRAQGLPRNLGMRIDHLLISPSAVAITQDAGVYKQYRELEKPSDHAPVYLILNVE